MSSVITTAPRAYPLDLGTRLLSSLVGLALAGGGLAGMWHFSGVSSAGTIASLTAVLASIALILYVLKYRVVLHPDDG